MALKSFSTTSNNFYINKIVPMSLSFSEAIDMKNNGSLCLMSKGLYPVDWIYLIAFIDSITGKRCR